MLAIPTRTSTRTTSNSHDQAPDVPLRPAPFLPVTGAETARFSRA